MSKKIQPLEQTWGNATWEGSRRAMIRQSLKLTVRERLKCLEDLTVTSQKLADLNPRKKREVILINRTRYAVELCFRPSEIRMSGRLVSSDSDFILDYFLLLYSITLDIFCWLFDLSAFKYTKSATAH